MKVNILGAEHREAYRARARVIATVAYLSGEINTSLFYSQANAAPLTQFLSANDSRRRARRNVRAHRNFIIRPRISRRVARTMIVRGMYVLHASSAFKKNVES